MRQRSFPPFLAIAAGFALALTIGPLMAYDPIEKASQIDAEWHRAAPASKANVGSVLLRLERMAENCTLSDPGLATATNLTSGVAIVATMTFTADGVFSTINGYLSDGGGGDATAEAGFIAFTATTHDITANSASVQEAVYVFSTDSSGSITVTKGDTASGAGNANYPTTPAGETCFGAVRIAVAAGSTDFNATTDLLSDGHLTVTYYDLMVNPGDSQLE